ncbi:MAG: hypothetical protein CMF55_00530 [Legionellales bacterium]|nr:hypothetical protein [Legionellales bacterium]|tara:strand:+ start:159 stop:617 length:459 start_codon:yes stop_codon:yes gene_type:complete
MTRISYGGHGEVCLRSGGTMMMTVKPRPFVGGAEDIAMLLAKAMDIRISPRWDEEYSYSQVMGKIFAYERDYKKLTQKNALALITDSYYLGSYENWRDLHERYDEDIEGHKAMLDTVHRIWPRFVQPTEHEQRVINQKLAQVLLDEQTQGEE